jgi:hypothetical protein
MAKFKSPRHISTMQIIDKYGADTQLKMKKGIVDDYLYTIKKLTDSARRFSERHLFDYVEDDLQLIKVWSKGLEDFLKQERKLAQVAKK